MTELPAALGGHALRVWRLEAERHIATWAQAEGAWLVGGRWSPPGRRVIYTSLDPATAILEVGVHKGLQTLDTVPHRLLCLRLGEPGAVRVLPPAEVPDPAWLRPGIVSSAQQLFGAGLLAAHPLLVLPSVVSTRSWNLVIDVALAAGLYTLESDESFVLDLRLHTAA